MLTLTTSMFFSGISTYSPILLIFSLCPAYFSYQADPTARLDERANDLAYQAHMALLINVVNEFHDQTESEPHSKREVWAFLTTVATMAREFYHRYDIRDEEDAESKLGCVVRSFHAFRPFA